MFPCASLAFTQEFGRISFGSVRETGLRIPQAFSNNKHEINKIRVFDPYFLDFAKGRTGVASKALSNLGRLLREYKSKATRLSSPQVEQFSHLD